MAMECLGFVRGHVPVDEKYLDRICRFREWSYNYYGISGEQVSVSPTIDVPAPLHSTRSTFVTPIFGIPPSLDDRVSRDGVEISYARL